MSASVNVCLWNIQGLITKSTNKLLSTELTDVMHKNDLILLTETWTCKLSDIAVNGLVKNKSAKRFRSE